MAQVEPVNTLKIVSTNVLYFLWTPPLSKSPQIFTSRIKTQTAFLLTSGAQGEPRVVHLDLHCITSWRLIYDEHYSSSRSTVSLLRDTGVLYDPVTRYGRKCKAHAD